MGTAIGYGTYIVEFLRNLIICFPQGKGYVNKEAIITQMSLYLLSRFLELVRYSQILSKMRFMKIYHLNPKVQEILYFII